MDNNTTGSPANEQNTPSKSTSRIKTIRMKTLVSIVVVIFVTATVIFVAIYYFSRPLANIGSILPVNPVQAPKFLINIYEGKNRLSHPMSITVNKEGKIYISNSNLHTVEVISPKGKTFAFGKAGQSLGLLFYPYGLGILPNGNILVAEAGNFRIQVFTPGGEYVKTFLGQPNKVGLEKPGPLYVDSKGHVYVGDLSGQQVLILDPNGKLLRRIKNIRYPHGIAVDEERKKLFISDAGQVCVKVFSLNDTSDRPINIIKKLNNNKLFSMVRGLTVDNLGRLYVADTISSSIRVFDANGEYLFSFGEQGFDDGQFLYPNGIFVDDTGKIYVADWGNNRVAIWGYPPS